MTEVFPFFPQRTLPKFPSNTVGQAKFINMLNRSLSATAGTNLLSLEPYTVITPARSSLTYKNMPSCSKDVTACPCFFFLFLKANEEYLTFKDSFVLDLGTDTHIITLKDGTRNTISISETEATLVSSHSLVPPVAANM